MWQPERHVQTQPIDDVTETLEQLQELGPGALATYRVSASHQMHVRVLERDLTRMRIGVLRQNWVSNGRIQTRRYDTGSEPELTLQLHSDQQWRLAADDDKVPLEFRRCVVSGARLLWNRARTFDPYSPLRFSLVSPECVGRDVVRPDANAPEATPTLRLLLQEQKEAEDPQTVTARDQAQTKAALLETAIAAQKVQAGLMEAQRKEAMARLRREEETALRRVEVLGNLAQVAGRMLHGGGGAL